MRRILGGLLVLVVLVGIGVGGFLAVERLSDDPVPGDDDGGASPAATVEVMRTDLVERETLDGTLRFSDPGAVLAQAAGVITGLPDPGDVVERGGVLYELDGVPVVLMFGERPAWRSLSTDSEDGADIEQLEANLEALGFAEGEELTVDEEFTALTEDLVEAWQESLGIPDTGVVDLGSIWYATGPLRIGAVRAMPGAPVAPGAVVMETSGTDREVLVQLDADRSDLLSVGDGVQIELPDGVETSGTVAEVSRVVTLLGAGPEARRVIEVLITLDDPAVAGTLDEAPVDVDVERDRASAVLAVPVNALLALAEGGYALEYPDGRLVGVEIGTFADGLVEVRGEIGEGDLVVVPR